MTHYVISDIRGTTYNIYAHHVISDNESDASIYFYGISEDEKEYVLVAQFIKANIVGFYITTDTPSDGKCCDTCRYEKLECDDYPCRDCDDTKYDMWKAKE